MASFFTKTSVESESQGLARGRQTFHLNKEIDEEENYFLFRLFHIVVNFAHKMAKLKDKPRENISVATEVRYGNVLFRYSARKFADYCVMLQLQSVYDLFLSVEALRSS